MPVKKSDTEPSPAAVQEKKKKILKEESEDEDEEMHDEESDDEMPPRKKSLKSQKEDSEDEEEEEESDDEDVPLTKLMKKSKEVKKEEKEVKKKEVKKKEKEVKKKESEEEEEEEESDDDEEDVKSSKKRKRSRGEEEGKDEKKKERVVRKGVEKFVKKVLENPEMSFEDLMSECKSDKNFGFLFMTPRRTITVKRGGGGEGDKGSEKKVSLDDMCGTNGWGYISVEDVSFVSPEMFKKIRENNPNLPEGLIPKFCTLPGKCEGGLCKMHAKPFKTEVCGECSQLTERIVKHANCSEHLGRIGQKAPYHSTEHKYSKAMLKAFKKATEET
jgi:hypothetical protein